MNKNRIKGRRVVMSWHNTAKSFGSHTEVNAAVVQGSIVFLPGEASSTCDAGLNLPSRHRGSLSNGRIERRGVSRGHSSCVSRAGSSCRRVTRPVKESGGLTRNEGPNLMGRCRPDYSLNLRRIITSRNDAALSVRTIRKRHLRTRMSGVVGAGGVNAPRYPIRIGNFSDRSDPHELV